MAWAAIGGAAVGVIGGAIVNNQAKKAQEGLIGRQQQIAADAKYTPIDIEKLKADAHQQAIQNATDSLALERQLTPNVAATRDELGRQINSELAQGGNLPADVVNRVNSAGRVAGARSGVPTNAVPLTAALLGISSLDLANQRRQAAQSFLSGNPLPEAGLDPGTLASLEVAQNAAENQFNLEKAGVASNLANSEEAARASQLGSQAGLVSSIGNLATKIGTAYAGSSGSNYYDDLLKKSSKNSANQNPSLNPLMGTAVGSGSGLYA